MTEFEQDCIEHYGKILTGKFKHYCCGFDYLPIDETCFEFELCLCDFGDENMEEKKGYQNPFSGLELLAKLSNSVIDHRIEFAAVRGNHLINVKLVAFCNEFDPLKQRAPIR